MNASKNIIVLFLILCFSTNAYCQNYRDHNGRVVYEVLVSENNDSLFLFNLNPFYVFPPLKFKNKSQERFYWKTIRDVKKTLPYARIVAKTLNDANADLEKLPDDAARKKYLKNLEKEVKKKYEPDLKKMTFSQGKMLIRLINRETSYTSYDLIKMYRGTFAAFFWQGVAKVFGADLKLEYNGSDKEKIIERVIILVEAGQL